MIGPLVRPTLRSSPWGQLLGGGACALVLILLTTGNGELPLATVVDRLRLTVILLAIGVAGALDDATRPQLDGVPLPLLRRQLLRIGVASAVTIGWWLLVLLATAYHPATLSSGSRAGALPVVALSVLVLALVTLTLAVAGLATRRHGGSGVIPAAGTAVALPALLLTWGPIREMMWPDYLGPDPAGVTDATWVAAHQRWGVAAAVAGFALVWSIRDPWRARTIGRTDHQHPSQRRAENPPGPVSTTERSFP